jgi:hypothetical protein
LCPTLLIQAEHFATDNFSSTLPFLFHFASKTRSKPLPLHRLLLTHLQFAPPSSLSAPRANHSLSIAATTSSYFRASISPQGHSSSLRNQGTWSQQKKKTPRAQVSLDFQERRRCFCLSLQRFANLSSSL